MCKSMAAVKGSVVRVTVLAGLSGMLSVTGFYVATPAGVRATTSRKSGINRAPLPKGALGASATEAPDFGGMLGDKVASVLVNSPIYPLLKKQAKSTMKKSAQVGFCVVAVVPWQWSWLMFCRPACLRSKRISHATALTGDLSTGGAEWSSFEAKTQSSYVDMTRALEYI